MDVDSDQPTRNSPFIHYFDVSNFPWQEPRPEQIRLRRALMYDSLIFDILLTSGGINNPYSVYPPESPAGLQELLDAIDASHYDSLKKDCLVYFLLKWHQDGRERGFQQQRSIPPQFAALADAYWHLDTGINVPRAVAILSDSRLNREYASKIIRAISLVPDSAPLIRNYVQTAKPLLVEPLDIESYALALVESSFLEAWRYCRTFTEEDDMRTRLFKKILEWSITPKPRPSALTQLIALPLSVFEESVLNEFVQKPPPDLNFSSVAVLQDLICVRLLQGGRYAEAIKLDQQFSSTTLPRNLSYVQDRIKMVRAIYTALPSVERALVDLELDPTLPKKPTLSPKKAVPVTRPESPEPQRNGTQQADLSMSQSWEVVGLPDALLNKSTPLRDIRTPNAVTDRRGHSPFPTSTAAPSNPPILPVYLNGTAGRNSSTPRKSLPLSASLFGSAKASPSLGAFGKRIGFGGSPAVASPTSGMKVPNPASSSSHGPGHGFISASQQQNAFYQPPAKTNGVKRALDEDSPRSPGRPDTSAIKSAVNISPDVNMDSQGDEEHVISTKKRGKKSSKPSEAESGQEGPTLQFSVFGTRQQHSPDAPALIRAPKRTPGTLLSEDEDEDDGSDSHRRPTRTRGARNNSNSTISKPPAKRSKQAKAPARNFPGALVDEDYPDHEEEEEEDQVAPLRPPSPVVKRPIRKARSSASVEATAEDGEGVQTRRRSNRLTSSAQGSPEPPATKSRKSARGTRKRRS